MAAPGDGVTRQDRTLRDVAAIVVHHRSYDTVSATVHSLIEEGLAPDRVLVIDNSEEPGLRYRLADSIPERVEISYVPNRGYGAAVNAGLDLLESRRDDATYVLVTSHESRPQAGAVAGLRDALEDDPAAAVSGPTLVTGEGNDRRIWSEGGYLAPVTHRPKHHGYGSAFLSRTGEVPARRQWLDGAFLLYRRVDLAAFRFSEDYFLYMEETDLHLRLGQAGRTLLWVPDAVAWQSSNGVPAYYFARNLRLLYARNDAAWRRLLVARALVLRRLIGAVLSGCAASEVPALTKGSLVRLPPVPERRRHQRLVIVNPLGTALTHYQAELLSLFGGSDRPVTVLTLSEPSAGNRSRVGWLTGYMALLARAAVLVRRGAGGEVLSLWPVLGYLDLVLLRTAVGGRSSLVVHDPVPLVRAVGYGNVTRRLAARLGAGVRVIVHSEAASRALDPAVQPALVSVLPHPVLPPRSARADRSPTALPVIRVLGQYKPDRDTEALAALAEHFGERAVLEVHGRGWPPIPGWTVRPLFLSETEMDALIASSDVVLIAYRRFFQSGVAIRCLEQAVPVVGPAGSSLEDLYGQDSRLLVRAVEDWARAVAHAIEGGREEALAASQQWRARAEKGWRTWLTT